MRDRLGWYSRPSVPPSAPKETQVLHQHSHRHSKQREREMHGPARRLTNEPVEIPVDGLVEAPVDGPVMKPAHTGDNTRTRMVKEVRVKAGHHTTTTLEDYVHSKYGVPKEQLSHMLTQQGLESRTVDTSGCGRGPLIRVPIEASVLLPTPTHDKADHMTNHVTNSRTLLTTQVASQDNPTLTNAYSTLSPPPHSPHRHHLPPPHSPHRHHPPPPHSPHRHLPPPEHSPHRHHPPPSQQHPSHTLRSVEGLQFEARFECGNLHKTQQM